VQIWREHYTSQNMLNSGWIFTNWNGRCAFPLMPFTMTIKWVVLCSLSWLCNNTPLYLAMAVYFHSYVGAVFIAEVPSADFKADPGRCGRQRNLGSKMWLWLSLVIRLLVTTSRDMWHLQGMQGPVLVRWFLWLYWYSCSVRSPSDEASWLNMLHPWMVLHQPTWTIRCCSKCLRLSLG
jgi:hypothetical protein